MLQPVDPEEARKARLAVVGRREVTPHTRSKIEERLLLQHWKSARKQYYARYAEDRRAMAAVSKAQAAAKQGQQFQ